MPGRAGTGSRLLAAGCGGCLSRGPVGAPRHPFERGIRFPTKTVKNPWRGPKNSRTAAPTGALPGYQPLARFADCAWYGFAWYGFDQRRGHVNPMPYSGRWPLGRPASARPAGRGALSCPSGGPWPVVDCGLSRVRRCGRYEPGKTLLFRFRPTGMGCSVPSGSRQPPGVFRSPVPRILAVSGGGRSRRPTRPAPFPQPKSSPPPCQSRARLPKRVKRPSKLSSTDPIGPWRCLPMITSALP
jgi:hypothetical protein